MQKTLNNLLLEKLETLNRNNSNKTLLFNLSDPSVDHHEEKGLTEERAEREQLKLDLERERKQLSLEKQELTKAV